MKKQTYKPPQQKCQPRLLDPQKLSFIIEGNIKTSYKLRILITLQKIKESYAHRRGTLKTNKQTNTKINRKQISLEECKQIRIRKYWRAVPEGCLPHVREQTHTQESTAWAAELKTTN